jgi:copper chaperone CopZ
MYTEQAMSPTLTSTDHVDLALEGLHCASCVGRAESALSGVAGVDSASVNLATERAAIDFDPAVATVPQLVRTGVSNVLGNLGDLWSATNHFLQGKGASGLEQGMRFLTNTLFGLGGLLDGDNS